MAKRNPPKAVSKVGKSFRPKAVLKLCGKPGGLWYRLDVLLWDAQIYPASRTYETLRSCLAAAHALAAKAQLNIVSTEKYQR